MNNYLTIPNLYEVFEVKSCSKNRIRVLVGKLKNNPSEINELKSKLKMIDGINNFKIMTSLGSLTVEFDNNKISLELMIGILLKLLSLENEIFKKREPKLKNILTNIFSATDIVIFNKSKGLLDTKSLTGLVLLTYGLKKFKTEPILPIGATLIWWSYRLLSDNKRSQ